MAPQITGILWPVPSPDIVNSSWQSKPVSSIVVAPASRLNDSKSSRKLHTPENDKKIIDINGEKIFSNWDMLVPVFFEIEAKGQMISE